MVSGVYLFENKKNKKVYIGSSKNIGQRRREHLHQLKNNKHHSIHLQRAWNKYGECFFNFKVVEECNNEKLSEREQYWIDKYKSFERKNGYNICPFANMISHSEETKRKISKSIIGHPNCNTGRTHFKKGHIPWNKGLTKDTDSRIKEGYWKNKKFPDWYKKKLSEAHKGKKFSIEHKKKISASLKGGNKSSFKKGHIPWNKGKHLSKLTKLKISYKKIFTNCLKKAFLLNNYIYAKRLY